MFGNTYSNPYGYGTPFGYIPPTYNNYNQPNQNNTPTSHATNTNKIFVNGIEDVRSRSLPPNSDYAFLDNDKPILYQKVVDSKGQFDVKVYDIVPHKDEAPAPSKYVLRADFDLLADELALLKDQIAKLGGTKNESVES